MNTGVPVETFMHIHILAVHYCCGKGTLQQLITDDFSWQLLIIVSVTCNYAILDLLTTVSELIDPVPLSELQQSHT